MPPDHTSKLGLPTATEPGHAGGECRYSPLWQHKKSWLPTKAGEREIGLRPHRVSLGGIVEEYCQSLCAPKKKPKGISTRAWGGR